MEPKRRRMVAIVVIVVAVVIAGYYGMRAMNGNNNGALQASGTIEAVDVNVSPELSGKVSEVLAEEGQTVKAGDVLLKLDDTLLQAQRDQAAAGLDSAQAAYQTAQDALTTAQSQYQITLATALNQSEKARLQSWFTKNNFDQPDWYFTTSEQITAAQADVDAAQKQLSAAQEDLNQVVSDLNNAQFVQAEQRLNQARLNYLVTKQVYGIAQNTGGISPDQIDLPPLPAYAPSYQIKIGVAKKLPQDANLSKAGQDAYNAASQELTDAEQAYNDLLSTDQAQKVLKARAAVVIAQENYYAMIQKLFSLQVGDQSPSVIVGQNQLKQAQSGVDQAKQAVDQAQASLDLIDVQMGKLEVKAPMDGVILTRNIEPGEFVQPGASAFTMANISQLTITVYVPEDQYGQISLHEKANVSVDSFPGEKFSGEVTYISDQAEFTPRNVQTVEGRSSTVYAIKLTVDDPQGKLKLGMPADVTFDAK